MTITADVALTEPGILRIRLHHAEACTKATVAELTRTTEAVADRLTTIIAADELGFELHRVAAEDGLIVMSYAQDDASMCDGSDDIAVEVGIEACAHVGLGPHEG